jgi:hypothetical protein
LRLAATEAGERALVSSNGFAGTTVWYRFVAPSAGILQLRVSGDSEVVDPRFRARLAVYREPAAGAVTLASLALLSRSPVGSVSSDGDTATAVVAGTAYAIVVDRGLLYNDPLNDFQLSWSVGGEGIAAAAC